MYGFTSSVLPIARLCLSGSLNEVVPELNQQWFSYSFSHQISELELSEPLKPGIDALFIIECTALAFSGEKFYADFNAIKFGTSCFNLTL